MRSSVEERASRIARRQAVPSFDECSFEAYVIEVKVKPGGDLDIRLGVQPAFKWDALKLSDAAGITIQVEARRR